MERTTAIFHAQDRMDEAVRELERRGVEPERIDVTPDPKPRSEPPPHALWHLPFGVHYAGVGAAIGMLVGLALSGSPGGRVMSTIWLVLVMTGLSAVMGGLIGVLVGAFRMARWSERVTPHRFLLRVDTDDEEEHEVVTRTLASYGGELRSA